MKPNDTKRLKKEEKEILDYYVAFCEKNKLKYYLSDNKASISFVNISDIYVSDDNTVLKILCSLKNENLNVNLLYIIKGELQYFLSDFNCAICWSK